MNTNSKIIILTASYGEGHQQSARSLQQSFQRQGIDRVHIIDLMKEAHPLLASISEKLYAGSTRLAQYGLDYYGLSYYATHQGGADGFWNHYFNRLARKKLQEIIVREQPDAIINTFPFGASSELCSPLGIPVFTVITDFTLHSRWLHKSTDKYYVAVPELREQLVFRGFPRERIQVSGIPVRRVFELHHNSHSQPYPASLDRERRTILFFAGSYIQKNAEELIRSLNILEGVQLVVVCGKNGELERKLKEKYEEHPHMHIYGYTEHPHEFMRSASCIVTKAGGLTLSEAIALKKPLFIYKPLAGQERENARFLNRKKAAWVSDDAKELAAHIHRFFMDESLSVEQRRKLAALKRRSSSDFIAKDIMQSVATVPDKVKKEK